MPTCPRPWDDDFPPLRFDVVRPRDIPAAATVRDSPSWHTALRRARQRARRTLRLAAEGKLPLTSARVQQARRRLDAHHGSAPPTLPNMSWECPLCNTVNSEERRRCTQNNCSYPGGPAAAWAAKWDKRAREAEEGGRRYWRCSCGYDNFSSRRTCKKCNKPPPAAKRVAAEPTAAAPKVKAMPQKKEAAQKPATFGEQLKQEAAQFRDHAPMQDDEEEDTNDARRAELQEEFRKAEAAVQKLEPPLGGVVEPDLQPVLEKRRARRDELRAQLHAPRPLRTQLRAWEVKREKAEQRQGELHEQIGDLQVCLAAKYFQARVAGDKLHEALTNIAEIQKKLAKEELDGETDEDNDLAIVSQTWPKRRRSSTT